MGLYLEKELDTGVVIKYHRIVALNVIVNECNIIELKSYISPAKREEEKKLLEQGKEQGEAVPMNVFSTTQFITIPYDENMNIVSAYEYIQSLDEFEGAVTYSLNDLGDGIQEVIKKDDEEMPIGDYTNPILYHEGMPVEAGKFYTNEEDIWEAIQSGTPNSFEDRDYFDIIE